MSVTYRKGRLARVAVDGLLDVEAARVLDDLCDQLVRDEAKRLELDLTGVTTYTSAGAGAVSHCLMLRRRLEGGVGVIVATDAGRAILLESMALT